MFFNTTSRRCQLEAAYSQTIHDMYKDQGLITIGIGSGWTDTYDCKDWSKNYDVSYPIINDDRLNLKSLFVLWSLFLIHFLHFPYLSQGMERECHQR
mgnify:CR=1 FL=1